MENDLIIPLSEARDALLVGGKAAALGELNRAGFNVPDGFVVTAAAYQKMTHLLESWIVKHFDRLNNGRVAVRSSAIAEDSHEAAWAGQFDSFLNTDRNHLIENIEKCWSSAGSARAQAYAQQKSLQSGPVAVLVQNMVEGDISGVAFSVHPVTKDPKHMIIEAAPGLADQVVSGKITPDHYVIDKGSFEVIDTRFPGAEPKLDTKQIEQLADSVNKIESRFGYPVDVEWSFAGGELYILQSRPITTLKA